MKIVAWMQKYLSMNCVFVSFFVGALSFLMLICFTGWRLAMLFGLLMTLGLMLVLPVIMWLTDRRYRDVAQQIGTPVLLSINVNVLFGKHVRNGYLYLTDDALLILCRDKKPYWEITFNRTTLDVVCQKDAFRLLVYSLEETVPYQLTSNECGALFAQMRSYGWPCREDGEEKA